MCEFKCIQQHKITVQTILNHLSLRVGMILLDSRTHFETPSEICSDQFSCSYVTQDERRGEEREQGV